MQNKNFLSLEEEQIDFKAVFDSLRQHWYYFAIAVPVFLLGSYFYIKSVEPIYEVNTTVIIDDGSSTTVNAADFFSEDVGGLFGGKNNINNEIEILKSYNMVNRAIRQLDFDVSYFRKDAFTDKEIYKRSPFRVDYDSAHAQVFGQPFSISFISQDIFVVSFEAENFWSMNPSNPEDYARVGGFSYQDTLHLGQVCSTKYFSFSLQKTSRYKYSPDSDNSYFFVINSVDQLTKKYRGKMEITPAELASVIDIHVNGPVVEKEIDFLNTFCQTYIQWQLEKKNQIATNTIDFIDSQILQITDSLQGAESQLESFRRNQQVMDINVTAANANTRLQELEREQSQYRVKDQYYRSLLNYLSNSDFNTIVAPSSIGIDDPLLNANILELKRLNQEKVSISLSAGEKNQELKRVNGQIEYLQKSMLENVKNIIQTSQIALDDVNRRIGETRGLIYSLPSSEKNLVKIQRKFDFSDNLYNYLLQKRAEAGIAKASSMPDNYVLDYAQQVGGDPVSPKKTFIYFLGLLLGLLTPASIILIKSLMSDQVTNKAQLEKMTSVPFLGSIMRKRDEKITILNSPQSGLAESFRALRINLQYLTAGQDHQVVGITSTISGEGKTFCAFNLAVIMAISGKKTVIIGADLRKPKLATQLEMAGNSDKNQGPGLSTYLINKASMTEIIQATNIENLDVISSGPIPPNPAELLESARLNELMEYLRQEYDYVIVDAPPVGLVTDYFTLMKYADITIYVVRQGYSKVQFVADLERYHQEKRFKNISVLLNDVTRSSSQYGYGGYGYGYYSEDKKTKKGILEQIRLF